MKVILATTSKYKIAAFRNLGIEFTAEPSHVDEKVLERDDPRVLVRALAAMKAKAVAAHHDDALVIGLDSVGAFDGAILEKPADKREAIDRLKRLSGQEHQTYTGICIIDARTGREETRVVETTMRMRELTDEEITAYVMSDPNVTEICLGYDPEAGRSAAFIAEIHGSYHNLLNGMPIETIAEMMKRQRHDSD